MLEVERTYALERFDSEKLRTMVAEIELLEYMRIDQAAVSVQALHALMDAEELWAERTKPFSERDESEIDKARHKLDMALRKFKKDARKELGTYVDDDALFS